ncbi:MAG: hypothetical protein GWP08_09400 [Nitrospiraceae bacterium]|nr:hypothetical protein [Nitrospiraceae bacterium]
MITKERHILRLGWWSAIAVLFALLIAAVSWAGTHVESFGDAPLQGMWSVSNAFAGQPDSITVGGGLCTFHKRGASPGFSQSLSLLGDRADNRTPPPWSVEYTIPDTSALMDNGGYLCNRFWMSGAAAYDWVYVGKRAGMITVGTADGTQILFSFPGDATSLLKIRFDVTLEGLAVYATTDIGSYGPPKTLTWQRDIALDTPLSLDIMASDMYAPSAAKPFDIAIKNLTITTGGLADVVLSDEDEVAAGAPRLNPRCEPIGSKNLIRNASFECGADLWSSLGKQTGWGGELSGLHGVIEPESAWHGRASLRIDMGPGVTPVTCFDGWPPDRDLQHAPLAANIGWMVVTPDQPVTLSAYLRASVAGTKARFLFRFAKNALDGIQQASHDVVLSTEWTRYTVTQTALDEDMCIAIGPDMTAMPDETVSCWIDAVQLEAGAEATAFETLEPVEIGFQTGRYGNVYDIAEPIVLTVEANNSGAADVAVSLRMEMENFFGDALTPSMLSVAIPAGGRVSEPWTLELPGKGYFRARITWTANGRDHVRVVELTAIQPYAEDDSPFGLNHPAPTARQLRLLSKAGLRWVRDWAVNWDWVEPTQGQVSWASTDEQLEYVASADMKTLVVFPNPSTNWASSAPSSVEPKLWFRLAYAPKDPDLLFDFLGKAVARYQKSCTHWEFLNEPLWVPNFCLPQSAGYTVADYIELLEGAYGAIKAADPNAKVIAGLAIEPKFPLGDQFITGGGLKYCDLLNLHPYGGLTAPEDFIPDMKRIQRAMDAQGERKPIWATEAAYYAVDDKPWTPWAVPPGHFSANLLLSDERTCADYIVRQAIILLAHGVEKIFYHEPIEGPVNYGSWNIENTFLAEESVPKKSYAAISALATLLGPAPRYVAAGAVPAASGNAKVLAYAFQCGPKSVVAAWAPDAEKPSGSIKVAPGVTAFDVVGNEMPSPLSLGTSPTYFVSSSLTADAIAENWFREEN